MNELEIVVFANSSKHGEHCVAGKNTSDKKWVRPVSSPSGGALNKNQIRYENPYGKFQVKTLQIIKLSYLKKVPLPNQPDNYLIDNKIWKQNYAIDSNEISNYLDKPESIWGTTDRLSFSEIKLGKIKIDQSLYLVKVQNLKLYFGSENKKRAKFSYNKINYDLAVTDPAFISIKGDEKSKYGVLCISLGAVFHGSCFKLVAGIF